MGQVSVRHGPPNIWVVKDEGEGEGEGGAQPSARCSGGQLLLAVQALQVSAVTRLAKSVAD